MGSGISFAMNVFGLLFLSAVAGAVVWGMWEPLRRATASERWDVFVSYRSLDRGLIALLVSAMSRHGFRVWFDQAEINEETSHQGRFRLPISRGLQLCRLTVIFTSAEYCVSQYCRQEAQFLVSRLALEGTGRIVEVRLDGYASRDVLRLPEESPLIEAAGCSADDPVRIKSLAEEIIRAIEKGLQPDATTNTARDRRILS